MIDTWLKVIYEGRFVGSVMVDFKNAFDMVEHRILLKKLSMYRCSDLVSFIFIRSKSNSYYKWKTFGKRENIM